MDTDTLPPIRPKTNEKEDRKAVGFLPSLLSKLGLGGAPGAGGVAAGSSYGAGSTLWGALIGTKAGLVALVLAGTTVAAGLGVIGSRGGLFGGSDGRLRPGGLFWGSRGGVRPTGSQQPAADPNGVSSSLDMFVHANRAQEPAAGEGAPSAEGASDAAAAAPGSSSAEGGTPDNTNSPANVGGSPGAKAAGARLSPMKGFGGASGGVSMGGGLSARGSGSGSGTEGVLGSGRAGALRRGSRAPVVGGRRTAIGRGGRNALNQALSANRAVRGNLNSPNVSSQGSGVTYDGGRGAPAIGGAGGIDGGGLGTGGAGVNQGVRPNQSAAPRDMPAPPPVGEEENATPWQWAIYTAMGAMAVALIAFMAMNFFKNKAKTAVTPADFASAMSGAKISAGIATMAAAVATVMGVLIMTTYGQMSQGLIWTAVGGLFTAYAAYNWMNLGDDSELKAKEQALKVSEVHRLDIAKQMGPNWDIKTTANGFEGVWKGTGSAPTSVSPVTAGGTTYNGTVVPGANGAPTTSVFTPAPKP